MTSLTQLIDYSTQLLSSDKIKDYCPNGLQVEVNPQVKKIVTGVTACQALIEAAHREKADTLLVHHGYFWKNEAAPLVGLKARRIRSLFEYQINLIAWHLPLDMHLEYGNNIQLANICGFENPQPLDLKNPLLWHSQLDKTLSPLELTQRLTEKLNRPPLHIAGGKTEIKHLFWCTGGAQNMIEQAIMAGADAYISGEISESTTHIAREAGIHYFAAGHHATERYGVIALGNHLKQQFTDLEVIHIDIDNPV